MHSERIVSNLMPEAGGGNHLSINGEGENRLRSVFGLGFLMG